MIQKTAVFLILSFFLASCSSKPAAEDPAPAEQTVKTSKKKKKKSKKTEEQASEEENSDKDSEESEPEKTEETATKEAKADPSKDLWGVRGIKKDVITFNNKKTLKTGLSQVKVITAPEGKNSTRYIILSGKECGGKDDCEGYVNVYVHRWGDDPAKTFTGGGAPYPGKLGDYRTQNIIQHYRVYWGECIVGLDPMALWIGWTMTTKKKRVKVAAAYLLNGEAPEFTSFDTPYPKLSDILPQVKAGTCHMIEELNQDTPSY